MKVIELTDKEFQIVMWALQAFREQKKEDISRRLICFQMEDRAIPRKGYTIWINDKERGVVTSGGFSSVLNMGIGMGYVNRKFSKAGNKIGIDIRGNVKNAIIKKPPLYTHGTLYS